MEITHFFGALWQLSIAMAPYILSGLLFAGILHEIIPNSIVTRHLGKDNITSVVKSTLFGIPLPVCSCGVVPLATSIKKSGASKGATLSFLISTPITGVDSILATYGIFGWIFTIYRVITSMIIATAAGILANLFDKESKRETEEIQKENYFKAAHWAAAPIFTTETLHNVTDHRSLLSTPYPSPGFSSCNTGRTKKFSFTSVIRYAFITLPEDIAKALFWGLVIGALITVTIPDNLSEILETNNWLSYLIVIAIAVPMYVCATASLPIAAGLMLSGVSAGAAFVFLSAGPATNTVTIGVVKKMLGSRSLTIYLGTIVIGSILFGLGMDYVFDASNIDPASLIQMDEDGGIIAILSSIIFWVLILYFVLQPYFVKKKNCSGGSCCP